MNGSIELAGASGARYRYTPLEEHRAVPPSGANFVLAERTAEGLKLIYAGETDNLANPAWRAKLEEARRTRAHVQVLTRLNVTRAVREAERSDLVQEHHPPMNQSPN